MNKSPNYLTSDYVFSTIRNFQRMIGVGNGSITIHFAGGKAQRVKAEVGDDTINATAKGG